MLLLFQAITSFVKYIFYCTATKVSFLDAENCIEGKMKFIRKIKTYYMWYIFNNQKKTVSIPKIYFSEIPTQSSGSGLTHIYDVLKGRPLQLQLGVCVTYHSTLLCVFMAQCSILKKCHGLKLLVCESPKVLQEEEDKQSEI